MKNRRSFRLRGYDYSQPGMYFITLGTQNHLNVLGKIADGTMVKDENGKIVSEQWQ